MECAILWQIFIADIGLRFDGDMFSSGSYDSADKRRQEGCINVRRMSGYTSEMRANERQKERGRNVQMICGGARLKAAGHGRRTYAYFVLHPCGSGGRSACGHGYGRRHADHPDTRVVFGRGTAHRAICQPARVFAGRGGGAYCTRQKRIAAF